MLVSGYKGRVIMVGLIYVCTLWLERVAQIVRLTCQLR